MKDESNQTTRLLTTEEQALLNAKKEQVRVQYGENQQITDGQYDESLAVRCVNGTSLERRRME